MTIEENMNRKPYRGIQDQDRRNMVSNDEIPVDQDPEKLLNGVKMVSKKEMALEISLWIDTESFG